MYLMNRDESCSLLGVYPLREIHLEYERAIDNGFIRCHSFFSLQRGPPTLITEPSITSRYSRVILLVTCYTRTLVQLYHFKDSLVRQEIFEMVLTHKGRLTNSTAYEIDCVSACEIDRDEA